MKHKIKMALGALATNRKTLQKCRDEIKYAIERIDYAISIIEEELR